MKTRQTCELPAGLERVRRRFEQWRQTHKPPSRISVRLWAAAAKAAGTHGLHRTARTLRLDYYALKKHLGQNAAVCGDSKARPRETGGQHASPAFLELTPLASANPCECVVELENVGGAKMRIQLKGAAVPDVASLCRGFWNPGP